VTDEKAMRIRSRRSFLKAALRPGRRGLFPLAPNAPPLMMACRGRCAVFSKPTSNSRAIISAPVTLLPRFRNRWSVLRVRTAERV